MLLASSPLARPSDLLCSQPAQGLLSRTLMRALICLPTYLMVDTACALRPIPLRAMATMATSHAAPASYPISCLTAISLGIFDIVLLQFYD